MCVFAAIIHMCTADIHVCLADTTHMRVGGYPYGYHRLGASAHECESTSSDTCDVTWGLE